MKLLCFIGLHHWCHMDFNKGRWCRRCGKVQSSSDYGKHWKNYGTVEVKGGQAVSGTLKKNQERNK